MEPKQPTLFSMLVEDLNSTFLKQYDYRTGIIYRESESRSFGDEAIHECLKPYYYGQTRFTLHQSMFLKLADDCGLESEIIKSPKNGFPTPAVIVGRFCFTDHYGATAQDTTFIDASLVRQQHAAINLSLIQPNLFETPQFDDAKLINAERIYANMIHGCSGRGSDFSISGFLRIAFPCVTNPAATDEALLQVQLIKNYDLRDVLAKIIAKEAAAKAARPVVDIAIPKIKPKTQGGTR